YRRVTTFGIAVIVQQRRVRPVLLAGAGFATAAPTTTSAATTTPAACGAFTGTFGGLCSRCAGLGAGGVLLGQVLLLLLLVVLEVSRVRLDRGGRCHCDFRRGFGCGLRRLLSTRRAGRLRLRFGLLAALGTCRGALVGRLWLGLLLPPLLATAPVGLVRSRRRGGCAGLAVATARVVPASAVASALAAALAVAVAPVATVIAFVALAKVGALTASARGAVLLVGPWRVGLASGAAAP